MPANSNKKKDVMQWVELSAKQKMFLTKLSNYYIETRYPQEIREISRKITKTLSKLYLIETQEMIKCLDQQLK